jgi:hypothetical protein
MSEKPAAARTAWQVFKVLPWQMKVMVGVSAPLWLPVAFCAYLERKTEEALNA